MNYQPTLRDIQLIELKILKDVAKVCEENGIEYFLEAGTALGAVRHSGFIPWDDDIDIAMDRENYNRFLEIAPKLLGNEYHVQSRELGENCPYLYTKVRLNGTHFSEVATRNLDIHHGIFIDILPYDNVTDNLVERKRHFSKCRFWIRVFSLRSLPETGIQPQKTIKGWIRYVARKLVHWILQLVPFVIIDNQINGLVNKFNGLATENLTCYAYLMDFVIEKETLFPTKKLAFEDAFFSVPNNVERHLKKMYGNYMQLPPTEKRVGHNIHEVKIAQHIIESIRK